MQSNLSNLQFQQMQLMQQQQQRLANMMQQNQRNFPPDNGMNFNKMQEQQFLQQQKLMNAQKEINMMRPQPIPQPTMIPPSRSAQGPPLQPPPQSMLPSTNIQQQPFTSTIQSAPPAPYNPESNHVLVQTDAQKKNLAQYQARDNAYQESLNLQQKKHMELAQSKKKLLEIAGMERKTRMQHGPIPIFGPGYQGYGNGKTGTHPKIQYPKDKKHRISKREPFRFHFNAIKEQANKEEVLVPIRIELEHDNYKLRDTFTWNLNETLITPEQFAEVICEDLKLPVPIFGEQISKAIREQIDDYNLNASGVLKEETIAEENNQHEQEQDNQEKEQSAEINTDENKQGIELRTIIKLDITVGNWELVDQFEWDISCPNNSPEEFANKLARDLGLGGEFKTAIAHSIREQIHVYIKSLLLVGYEFNSSSIIDEEIKSSFLPRLNHIFRDNTSIERFTPSMTELTDSAIEKLDKDLMREARRKRRGTRARRGIVLPDREPQKTHRTGFAIPPESEGTDDQFLLTDPQQQNKRSAALKARMNIAAEAAIVEDDDFEGANKSNTVSFSNSRNATMNDYQRRYPNPNYGNMNAWQLNMGNNNNNSMIK